MHYIRQPLKAGWMYVGGRGEFSLSHPSNLLCMKVRHFPKVDCIVFTIPAKTLRSKVGWLVELHEVKVLQVGCRVRVAFTLYPSTQTNLITHLL